MAGIISMPYDVDGVATVGNPVDILVGAIPVVPIIRPQGETTTVGEILSGASVLSAIVGLDADWTIPTSATHVAIPPLTASRTWALPDPTKCNPSQDLVIVDEGGYLGGDYTLTLAYNSGDGASIPGYANGQILLDSVGVSVRLRSGLLEPTWGLASQSGVGAPGGSGAVGPLRGLVLRAASALLSGGVSAFQQAAISPDADSAGYFAFWHEEFAPRDGVLANLIALYCQTNLGMSSDAARAKVDAIYNRAATLSSGE